MKKKERPSGLVASLIRSFKSLLATSRREMRMLTLGIIREEIYVGSTYIDETARLLFSKFRMINLKRIG